MVDPDVALANFVPAQAIMRILRETGATAAALVAPVATSAIAMQLADADHEQSLTTRLIRQPEASPTIGQWDFGSVLWAVRLRHMLLASRRAATTAPSRPVTPTPPRPAASDRRPAAGANARDAGATPPGACRRSLLAAVAIA